MIITFVTQWTLLNRITYNIISCLVESHILAGTESFPKVNENLQTDYRFAIIILETDLFFMCLQACLAINKAVNEVLCTE